MKFKKVELPFAKNALEPYIDEVTVDTHYEKHHTAYETGFNAGIENTPIAEFNSIEEVMLNFESIQEDKKAVVRNAGGGLFNHNFYWTQFVVNRDLTEEENNLRDELSNKYGSLESFKEEFIKKGLSVFGSGWVWLVKVNGEFEIVTTPNQENPLMKGVKDIFIGVDVWEHAYYLKYKQNRKEYIENTLKLTFVK